MENEVKKYDTYKSCTVVFILTERVMYRKAEDGCVHCFIGLTSSIVVNMLFLYYFPV